MLAKLVIALLSPLGTALVLGVVAMVLVASRRRRLAVATGMLALAWLWIWSTPIVSDHARAALENAYPPVAADQLPSAQAIVVLGGAIAPAGAGRTFPDLNSAADRVWHGARLFHAAKAPVVLLSGGSDPALSATSEAEAMRVLLRDLGIPDEAILLESRSRNTRENARFSAALLRVRGINEILLVTSALHMVRARARFEAEGLTVHPAATDYEAGAARSDMRWLPSAAALDGSGRAIKEWVGQLFLQLQAGRQ